MLLYEISKTSSANTISVYTYLTDSPELKASNSSADIPLSSNAQLRLSSDNSVYLSDNKIVTDNSDILSRVEQVILYKIYSNATTEVAWTITESINHQSLDDMCIFQLQNGSFVLSILDTTTVRFFEYNNFDFHFLSDFFLSVTIDCFIYQILVLCIKALLFNSTMVQRKLLQRDSALCCFFSSVVIFLIWLIYINKLNIFNVFL